MFTQGIRRFPQDAFAAVTHATVLHQPQPTRRPAEFAQILQYGREHHEPEEFSGDHFSDASSDLYPSTAFSSFDGSSRGTSAWTATSSPISYILDIPEVPPLRLATRASANPRAAGTFTLSALNYDSIIIGRPSRSDGARCKYGAIGDGRPAASASLFPPYILAWPPPPAAHSFGRPDSTWGLAGLNASSTPFRDLTTWGPRRYGTIGQSAPWVPDDGVDEHASPVPFIGSPIDPFSEDDEQCVEDDEEYLEPLEDSGERLDGNHAGSSFYDSTSPLFENTVPPPSTAPSAADREPFELLSMESVRALFTLFRREALLRLSSGTRPRAFDLADVD